MAWFGVRVALALGVGALLFKYWGAMAEEEDRSAAFLIVWWLVLYGFGLFFLFGLPMMKRTGEAMAGLFLPSDSHLPIKPEYSIAEARLKQGRFAEAICAYREVIERFPDDVFAHLRLAEIYQEKLGNASTAQVELESALRKASAPDAFALTAHRLADFYERTLHDRERAVCVLRDIVQRCPDTKHASLAQHRIKALGAS
jgi:tetratricopeptide (TPR) repeat protein